MVLVRGSTFISAVFRGVTAEPRWAFGAKAMQVYAPGGMFWSRKSVIARNAPYTIESPHAGQIEARINFGEIASRHKGEKGFREGLPIIAYHIKTEMSGYKAPHAMRPEDYPSKKFHTVHTLDELKRMLEAKLKAAAPARYTAPPP